MLVWWCTFSGVLGVNELDELDVDTVEWSVGQLGACGLAGNS